MSRIIRVSVTFPPDLLKDFDEIIHNMRYENRSKAVQDAVRMFVSERRWLQEEKGIQAGVLMMLYNHEVRGLESTLTHTQHHFANVICSTMHIHLEENKCLEIIAVKGSVQEVKNLAQDLMTKKGVKQVKVAFIAP